jgi:hypothetical protein
MVVPPWPEATIAICSCKIPPGRTIEGSNWYGRFDAYCIIRVITTTLTSVVSINITDIGSRLSYTNRGYVGSRSSENVTCNQLQRTYPIGAIPPPIGGASNLESIENVKWVNRPLVNDQRVTTDYILVTREWRAIRLESYQQMP